MARATFATTATDGPLAYFITYRCHGTWLHGDVRGSVDREHRAWDSPVLDPSPAREAWERAEQPRPSRTLGTDSRLVVETALREVCIHRSWSLHAVNVRSNHVHVVVTAGVRPEVVLNTLKTWSTRHLRVAGLVDPGERIWSRHGSTRYLWSDVDVESACRYVIDGQDREPGEWKRGWEAGPGDGGTLPHGRASDRTGAPTTGGRRSG
jgi:REP element-mobilizing transposase RayT